MQRVDHFSLPPARQPLEDSSGPITELGVDVSSEEAKSIAKPLGWRDQAVLFMRSLAHWPWRETAHTLRQRFREDRLSLTAGSLTLTTLISLIPFMTVVLALFSAFPMFNDFQVALQKYFLQSLVPEVIAKPVLTAIQQFSSKASRLGAMGFGLLLVTALAMMLTIDRTLNAIWRVRRPRPITQRILVYWATATLGPLVLGASLALTVYLLTASKGWVSSLPGGLGFAFNALEFLMLLGGFAALFHFVPNTHVQARHAVAGALFVAVGIEVVKRLLAWYLESVPTYSVIYGAFATVPIFLIWIYLCWLIVLLGAVIAAYSPALLMKVRRVDALPGWRVALAMQMLRHLAAAREKGGGRTLYDIAAIERVDPLHVEPVAETLASMGWLAKLDEAGAARWVLLKAPEQLSAKPLIERFVAAPVPALAGIHACGQWERFTLADLLGSQGPSTAQE